MFRVKVFRVNGNVYTDILALEQFSNHVFVKLCCLAVGIVFIYQKFLNSYKWIDNEFYQTKFEQVAHKMFTKINLDIRLSLIIMPQKFYSKISSLWSTISKPMEAEMMRLPQIRLVHR